MKNFFSVLKYAPKRTIAVIATLIAAITIPIMVSAWGPSREYFTIAEPADYITFNSITDNPAHGDERNFAQVRDATASDTTYADSVDLIAGHEYLVYVYYHNNAAADLNLVATGTNVKIALPAVATKNASTKAVAYVSATNSDPKQVWDDISFNNTTGGDIAIRYIEGSAKIHNFGKTDGATLSDNIISTGALIGYSALDGRIPGCNEYAGYVTFKVIADQPNFTVSKQVRKTGTTNWTDEKLAVSASSEVDYLITYNNTGTTVQNDVVIKDVLPTGVTLKSGTTYIVNAANPNGLKISDNIASAGGINIGNYDAGAAAYIKFTANVSRSSDSLTCGANDLVNLAKADTNNGSKTDEATIVITKTCEDPEDPEFSISKKVRKTGTEEWKESIAIASGDSIDYMITYNNTGNVRQDNVVIKDTLPTGVTLVNGTTYLVNAANPNGIKVSDKIISTDGLNIGNYDGESTAYIKFTAKVTLADEYIKCGANTLVNTGKVISADGTESDTADIVITKICEDIPEELPKTGISENIAAIFGLGSLVTSGVYYVNSRRKFNK